MADSPFPAPITDPLHLPLDLRQALDRSEFSPSAEPEDDYAPCDANMLDLWSESFYAEQSPYRMYPVEEACQKVLRAQFAKRLGATPALVEKQLTDLCTIASRFCNSTQGMFKEANKPLTGGECALILYQHCLDRGSFDPTVRASCKSLPNTAEWVREKWAALLVRQQANQHCPPSKYITVPPNGTVADWIKCHWLSSAGRYAAWKAASRISEKSTPKTPPEGETAAKPAAKAAAKPAAKTAAGAKRPRDTDEVPPPPRFGDGPQPGPVSLQAERGKLHLAQNGVDVDPDIVDAALSKGVRGRKASAKPASKKASAKPA